MYCESCGARHGRWAKTCPQCGASLTTTSPSSKRRRSPNSPLAVGLVVAVSLGVGVGAYALTSPNSVFGKGAASMAYSNDELAEIAKNFISALYGGDVSAEDLLEYEPVAENCLPHLKDTPESYEEFVATVTKAFGSNKEGTTRVISGTPAVVAVDERSFVVSVRNYEVTRENVDTENTERGATHDGPENQRGPDYNPSDDAKYLNFEADEKVNQDEATSAPATADGSEQNGSSGSTDSGAADTSTDTTNPVYDSKVDDEEQTNNPISDGSDGTTTPGSTDTRDDNTTTNPESGDPQSGDSDGAKEDNSQVGGGRKKSDVVESDPLYIFEWVPDDSTKPIDESQPDESGESEGGSGVDTTVDDVEISAESVAGDVNTENPELNVDTWSVDFADDGTIEDFGLVDTTYDASYEIGGEYEVVADTSAGDVSFEATDLGVEDVAVLLPRRKW